MTLSLKLPKRFENSYKSSYGRILNIAGSRYYRGAAYLSSISALRIGCGFVALASVEETLASVAAQTPDIVLIPLDSVIEKINDFSVISIGCGLSTDNFAKLLFDEVLSECQNLDKRVVVDADGLNILSECENIFDLSNLILTPHPKEAAKLLKCSIDEIISNPEDSAINISKKYSCTTVLKLHFSVVCSKNGEIYVNDTGTSALSKAGSGDVLCGMISGLVAQGMNSFDAVKLGVYLHGLTGSLAAEDKTEYGVLASDLLDYIPLAIRDFA